MIWLVRTAIAALYPRTDDLPGAEDCDLEAFLRRFRRETTLAMWLGVVLGAIVFHASPVLTLFVPLPAFCLPRRWRERHAHRIATSGLYLVRQSIFVLKLAAGLCWGAHPAVRTRFALAPYEPDPDGWKT